MLSIATTATILALLLVTIVAAALIQIALRYTKPNIRYQYRGHRDREHTFFVRNLDSIHFKQPLHLIVSGLGLKYVGTQAGPWSRCKPVKLDDNPDGHVCVLVVFDEIPEDAAFAIRALCIGARPMIEVARDSPLQPRAFHRELAKFTIATQLRYYGLRYSIGVIEFLAIFLGGLLFQHQEPRNEDLILIGLAIIVAGLSFTLVIPFRGKTTIVGYLTSTEMYQYWGDRAGSGGGLLKNE